MRVRLRLDPTNARGWHLSLVARLEARSGVEVEIEGRPAPDACRLPSSAERLLGLEAKLLRRPTLSASQRLPGGLPARPLARGAPDHVIDLDGGTPSPDTWRLLFDGRPGDRALIDALARGTRPLAELRAGDRTIAAGRLGTDAHEDLHASLAAAFERTVTLIDAALGGGLPAMPMMDAAGGAVAPLTTVEFAFRAVGRLTDSARRRWHRLTHPMFSWRVGWRRVGSGPDLFDLRAHPAGGWTDLSDDGRRFYADPFPIEHDGACYVFVEEYPYATRKGIISVVRFGPDGPEGSPEPVLERPCHLSYPFVFARDGEVWMIPESAEAGSIDLYRAASFPTGWRREATLVAGGVFSDATLVEHDGQWWMFATVRDAGGSSSDALHLWSAPDFRGPWTPHPRNPVLIDCASARPAGRIVRRDGVLWRPVQDCRDAYGGAIGLARVDTLDRESFAQTVTGILRPGAAWPGHLLHTLNRAGGYEFIDGAGFANWRIRRSGSTSPARSGRFGLDERQAWFEPRIGSQTGDGRRLGVDETIAEAQ